MDFVKITERSTKGGGIEIFPSFMVNRSSDLMVRGKAFYAIWDEEKGLWSTDEYDVQRLVDQDLWNYKKNLEETRALQCPITVKSMKDFSSGSWQMFKNYLKQVSDNNHTLDERLTYSNTEVKKEDYVSKRLPYPLVESSYASYDEIISTLYDPDERAKLEWAIGSIVSGDSRYIQKFIVLYGEAGAGKSTILNIIQQLFDGYYTMFDAKALVGSSNAFSTEVFRTNPLVAIQHDGDLSKIEDNTKLNSIVSHEEMTMNEKFKSSYTARTNCFLFMATNRPVKITDAKSGIIRRLIDVKPSGRKLPPRKYQTLMDQIPFELGGIASHCLDVYQKMGRNYYVDYRPLDMIFQTDVFFNFVESYYDDFVKNDGVTLNRAYDMYKTYCDESLVDYKMAKYKFREELRNYFKNYDDRIYVDGVRLRSYYSGFLRDKFDIHSDESASSEDIPQWLNLSARPSIFDAECCDCKAQYASEDETPISKWDRVKTTLKDIDTSKLHYVMLPKEHIVIDFDLKDESGNKSRELNVKAASKWPRTYCELSKGGQGIHLHYIYEGDVDRLKRVYSDNIEIKVFAGKSSLRRRLSMCNDIPISTISGGLPLKEEKVVNQDILKSEKSLRDLINRNLRKEIHPGTKPSMDFIKKILDDAYASGMPYDVSDMEGRIFSFACRSTHQADYCIKLMPQLKLKSEKASDPIVDAPGINDLVFFDVEVFPNLFLVNWKTEGSDRCVRMINPTSQDIADLMKHKLVGFNCRRYDNHILYARYLGYSNEELYDLSQRIITRGDTHAMFREAYNISYTDVYDFSSQKQSLKKFEIDLGIHHQELGLPWDQPVPEEKWAMVAEYCDNDVIATEAVFKARESDWIARQILADVAGMSVNDTTNSLTTKIIFGSERSPQKEFNYRFMGEPECHVTDLSYIPDTDHDFTVFDGNKPIFPGYTFECGKSIYRGEEIGEGGYVYSEPGMYHNIALLDIASMHPSSIVAENLFGDKYTARFKEILDARIAIKHGEYDKAKTLLDGKLAKYLENKADSKKLAQALKIAINSVYGLTSAKFDNPFRDIRNKDNIVAKRGALFMVNLKHEVQTRGFTVAHIKTDSIKIPNATPEIIEFVQEYGREYGYNFEHEATYDRMCLVNDAVYIARFAEEDTCKRLYGYSPKECSEDGGKWTATGAQFAVPYLFKKLFSHEDILFKDLCEAKSVSTAMYIDFNENLPEDEHDYRFIGKTGLFCPVISGCGGGELYREKDGKYYSVSGCKGYHWMESEMVKLLGYEDKIDRSYYDKFVDDAIHDISQYGDFEAFCSVDCSDFSYDDIPPWYYPCEDEVMDCEHCSFSSKGGCQLCIREE